MLTRAARFDLTHYRSITRSCQSIVPARRWPLGFQVAIAHYSHGAPSPWRIEAGAARMTVTSATGQAPPERSADDSRAENRATPVPFPPSGSHGVTWRLWLGVLVGLVVATPLTWLLSFAAALPFMIGTFFFALFGLFVGATVFRVAAPGRPHGPWQVLAGTTLVVFFMFGGSLALEGRGFASDLAADAAWRTRDLGDRSIADFRATAEREIATHVATKYPPGGVLGYVRWVLDGGEIPRGTLPSVGVALRAPQSQWTWAARVVMSVAFAAFGVGAVTLGLSKPAEVKREVRADW